MVEAALVKSGLSADAINLVVVPSDLHLFEDALHVAGQVRLGTYYETVLRLFRFQNQTDGDAYLQSHPPVFYVKGEHADTATLPAPGYTDRAHVDNVDEQPHAAKFAEHGADSLAKVRSAS
jgi:hypothetical protein